MIKRSFERAFVAVRMAVAIIPLAACTTATGSERWGTTLAGPNGAVRPDSHETGENPTQVAQPLSVEYRHYDIYTRYRAAFENASERIPAHARGEVEGSPQTSGTSDDGADYNDAMSSCSARVLMMPD